MNERKEEIREGTLKICGQEEIKVQIKDDGENMQTGNPSNHDKIEIIYISPKS